jgi:hypothetical protein
MPIRVFGVSLVMEKQYCSISEPGAVATGAGTQASMLVLYKQASKVAFGKLNLRPVATAPGSDLVNS